MSCTKNTYPINLVETKNICDITCNLSFNYVKSSINVTNIKGVYLSIIYDQNNKSNVNFSSDIYSPSEIRIFTPSLHKYNGKHADAELIVNHNGNNNKHLMMCIPIVNKNYLSNSAITLSRIVQDMVNSRLNKYSDNLLINNYTINLNDIIPEKPYYFYEGCSNNDNFFTNSNIKIVSFDNTFNNNTSGAIHVDDTFIKNLKKLLVNPNNVSTVSYKSDKLFYNMNIPNNSQNKKDDIYIDCQPTNEEGEIYIPLNQQNKPPDFFNELSKLNINDKTMTIIKSLFGLLIMFVILWVAKTLMNSIIKLFARSDNSFSNG